MIDLIVIVCVIIFGIVGYKTGLIRSALTLVSTVVALILSFIAYPLVTVVLKITPLYQVIYKFVSSQVDKIDFTGGLQSQGNAIVDNITWLPELLTQQIKNNNNVAMYDLLGVSTIKEYVSVYITQMLIGILAILITWVVVKFFLTIMLKAMGGIVEHLPVISTFNHAGGFLFGLVKGVLTLSIIGLIIPILIGIPVIEQLNMAIKTSVVAKWLYENNLILILYNYFFNV